MIYHRLFLTSDTRIINKNLNATEPRQPYGTIMCIHIYIYMDVCVWSSVCICGWQSESKGFLSSALLDSIRFSGRSFFVCVVFMPNRQRALSA